ncbi:PREDICTED: rho GTPase-activating protein gacK-like [Lupinus angustifolius]|uniref:rho GTPase-activating protein gacK-like n=1 Tax=Lupinus angustifolius TaxID=3871 RepID=UPI00092E5431|nr:PREDICTED: rho GTPase-activating protein gacK-like [Lupinus angustifolius]
MATNIVQGKWDHVKEEEEESLLLCDVPITMINKKDQEKLRKEDSSYYLNEAQEEFDFLFFKEQQMCDADDVFFQGQILPLCPSFRSEYGLLIKHDDHHKGNHQLNHSQSISSNKSLEFQSNSSSRSSSVRSQNSSCSSSTSSTSTTISTINTTPRISISKPIIQNQFHTRPSPKPQLRKSQQKQTSGRKSSLSWEFFRIGLVPMHEIGLRDLKVHSTITTTKPFFSNPNKNCSNPSMNCRNPNMNCSNPNKSCSNPNKNHVSCNNSTRKNVKMGNKVYDHQHHHGDENNYDVLKQFVYKGSGLFMSGCKCSIETVALENVMIKCGTKSGNKTQSTKHAKKEKVVDLKKQKNREKK